MKELKRTKLSEEEHKIKILRLEDNKSFSVQGYKKASDITGVSVPMIKNIINSDTKKSKGYRFYDYRYLK